MVNSFMIQEGYRMRWVVVLFEKPKEKNTFPSVRPDLADGKILLW